MAGFENLGNVLETLSLSLGLSQCLTVSLRVDWIVHRKILFKVGFENSKNHSKSIKSQEDKNDTEMTKKSERLRKKGLKSLL